MIWKKQPIENQIASLNSKFTIELKESSSISIAAGERKQVSVPISKSGYTPVGILGVYTTQTQVMSITSFYVYGSIAIVNLYNTYNDARDGKVVVHILYMKDT